MLDFFIPVNVQGLNMQLVLAMRLFVSEHKQIYLWKQHNCIITYYYRINRTIISIRLTVLCRIKCSLYAYSFTLYILYDFNLPFASLCSPF